MILFDKDLIFINFWKVCVLLEIPMGKAFKNFRSQGIVFLQYPLAHLYSLVNTCPNNKCHITENRPKKDNNSLDFYVAIIFCKPLPTITILWLSEPKLYFSFNWIHPTFYYFIKLFSDRIFFIWTSLTKCFLQIFIDNILFSEWFISIYYIYNLYIYLYVCIFGAIFTFRISSFVRNILKHWLHSRTQPVFNRQSHCLVNRFSR